METDVAKEMLNEFNKPTTKTNTANNTIRDKQRLATVEWAKRKITLIRIRVYHENSFATNTNE